MPLPALDDEAIRANGSSGPGVEQGGCYKSDAIALVARVASSPHFSKAPKLQRFLIYVAEQSLAGRLDLVTEYKIGVEVFGRRESYSPGEDNIVRSSARILRKRLEDYFAGEGLAERYVLSVPRGGYALEVVERTPAVTDASLEPLVAEQSQKRVTPNAANKPRLSIIGGPAFNWGSIALLVTLIVLSALAGYYVGTNHLSQASSTPNIHRFWTAALGNRQTVIVPSDTGLTVVLGLIQKNVSVQDYVRNTHLKILHEQFPTLENWDHPNTHRYSDFVDVLAMQQFESTPEISAGKPTVRYVRDLKADEIEKGNTVLLGGSNANPWVQMFDQNLNFHLHFLPVERTFRIENRHPLGTESPVYPYGMLGSNLEAYGMVAVMPNLSRSGNVIMLEGTTNSGLQAAFAMLGDEDLMAQVCNKALRADGSLMPFEILLKTPGVGGSATRIEIIGMRTYP